MKAVNLLVLFTIAQSSLIINKNFVDHLKKTAPFEVFEVEENPFRDWTDEEIKSMLGPKEKSSNLKSKDVPDKINENAINAIPEHYDFRQEHPDCILPVKNQGNCAAGYAFGFATSLQQRYCFQNQERVNPDLSPQSILSCYTKKCEGDIRDIIYDVSGLVTQDCWPYSSSGGNVEACRTTCSTGKEWKEWQRESFGFVYGEEDAIKFHIFTNGPLISFPFDIYSDFMNYSSGIYEHISGELLGTHSTTLIGYGIEGSVSYYIGQNSWGPEWGESGYFRIKTTTCKITEKAYSLYPAYPPN